MKDFISELDYRDYTAFLLRPDSRSFLKINNVLDLDEHMGKKSLWEEYLAEKNGHVPQPTTA